MVRPSLYTCVQAISGGTHINPAITILGLPRWHSFPLSSRRKKERIILVGQTKTKTKVACGGMQWLPFLFQSRYREFKLESREFKLESCEFKLESREFKVENRELKLESRASSV